MAAFLMDIERFKAGLITANEMRAAFKGEVDNMEDELKDIFEPRIATRLAAFAQSNGFQTIEDFRAFIVASETKTRDFETKLPPTYESQNWIKLLRLPGLGRKSVMEIMRWAAPERYVAIERLKSEIAKAQEVVAQKQEIVKNLRHQLQDIQRSLPRY